MHSEDQTILDAVLEHGLMGIVVTDEDGTVLRSNPAFRALLGYDERELASTSLHSLMHPDDRRRYLTETHPPGAPGAAHAQTIDLRMSCKDGQTTRLHGFVTTHAGRGGRRLRIATIVDVAEHWQAHYAQPQSDRLAAQAADLSGLNDLSARLWRASSLRAGLEGILAATIAIVRADRGNIQLLDAGGKVLRIAVQHGLDPEFLATFADVDAGDDAACGRALRAGKRVVIEDIEQDPQFEPLRGVMRRNQVRAVQSTPLIGWSGNVLGMLSTHWGTPRRLTDVEAGNLDLYARLAATFIERWRAEDAIRQREQSLALALDASSAGVWHFDAASGTTRPDARACVILGLPPGAASSMRGDVKVDPADRAMIDERLERLRSDRGHDEWDVEFRVLGRNGESPRWVQARGRAERDDAGRLVRIDGIVLDVTTRKRLESEARANAARLEAALAAMPDAVFISDTEGHFTHFNEAFATIHRFRNKSECARWLADYPAILDVHGDDGRLVPLEQWAVPRALRGESVMHAEYTLRRKDTGETWVGDYNFAPVRNEQGDIIGSVVTGRDVTARKQAARSLQESEARLRSILDSAADSIVVIDEHGTVQSSNPATERIFGWTAADLAGKNVSVLMPEPYRSAHDGYLRAYREAGVSTLVGSSREVVALHRSGREFPVDISLAEWRNGAGQRFCTGTIRDLSERRRVEQALASSRRLEAVGQLAGGIAHDFNNLLAVIGGNLELAEQQVEHEETRRLIQRALEAVQQGGNFNRRLLALAKRRPLAVQSVDLNTRVEETAKLLLRAIGEHIAIEVHLADRLWTTRADPGEIDSALVNIAINARDSMPNGGKLTIATANVTLDASAAEKLEPRAAAGDYVRLTLADTGVGMSADTLSRALEPFFTTKGPGKGTGLGLSTVASFVEQSGGFMTIASAPGQGCVVSLYLPRAVVASARKEGTHDELPRGHGERILVVEDDADVRDVTVQQVRSLGYEVREAHSAAEAVERLDSGETFALVLSDVVMPGGASGYDVARWICAHRPQIRVVLCSGYREGLAGATDAEALAHVAFLDKPYSRKQLAFAIRDKLAS